MPRLFDMARLITRYSVPFTLEWVEGGDYQKGRFRPGAVKTARGAGAIVPLARRRLYEAGGALSAQDRNLYVASPLPGWAARAHLIYEGCRYTVEEETGFGDYADAAVYLLRWVGGFEEGQGG